MLATTKDRALLKSVGITDQGTSSLEDDLGKKQLLTTVEIPEFSKIVEECHFNWFAVDERINGMTKQIDVQKFISNLPDSANEKIDGFI